MANISDDTKKMLQDTINALGATCEIVGYLKDQLIANDFTREEAVMMCTEVLVELITSGRNNE